jgi:carbonic anhydrase
VSSFVSVIDDLIAANAAYAAATGRRHLGAPPLRRLAVVTCMDSRIDVFGALGLDLGQAHIIRNAGGLATDDVLRSLVLSQRALGTREVMLLSHTRCGLHHLDEAALAEEVTGEAGSPPPFAFGAFTDLDATVRASVQRLRSSPWLPHREMVRGFVFDVDTGLLREVT